MAAKQVLITGADGYLGFRLARKHLELTQDRVLLWIRASTEDAFRMKRENLARRLSAFEGRVSYRAGDLTAQNPFDAVDPKNIRSIIHAAAVTRFNVDGATARQVNIGGAEKVFDFAARCPALEGLGLLSTVYASGLKTGMIQETPLGDHEGFSNHYERSKWESETVLIKRFGHLPWRIFRLATVIADNDDGRVTQQNAFHNTLKLFYYGLLSLIPGNPTTPLYFVTGDFATRAIFDLMQSPLNRAIYHVSHTKDESLCLDELINLAAGTFEQDRDFKTRRVLKPIYADLESFNLLVGEVSAFGGGVVNQAIGSVAPFARQLFLHKEIGNRNLVSALADYHAPDPRRLAQNTCRYMVQTNWGKSVPHENP